jgi:hypothetical protein
MASLASGATPARKISPMLEPVSRRTYARIRELTRTETVAGRQITFCPCRLLPETVLGLKTTMREIARLWEETLSLETVRELHDSAEGARFFAGQVRLVEVQEGRPEMVGVWLPVPPDYPRRLKVQLIDGVEPFAMP